MSVQVSLRVVCAYTPTDRHLCDKFRCGHSQEWPSTRVSIKVAIIIQRSMFGPRGTDAFQFLAVCNNRSAIIWNS